MLEGVVREATRIIKMTEGTKIDQRAVVAAQRSVQTQTGMSGAFANLAKAAQRASEGDVVRACKAFLG